MDEAVFLNASVHPCRCWSISPLIIAARSHEARAKAPPTKACWRWAIQSQPSPPTTTFYVESCRMRRQPCYFQMDRRDSLTILMSMNIIILRAIQPMPHLRLSSTVQYLHTVPYCTYHYRNAFRCFLFSLFSHPHPFTHHYLNNQVLLLLETVMMFAVRSWR